MGISGDYLLVFSVLRQTQHACFCFISLRCYKKRMFCWLKQTKNSSSDNEDNRCLCINALQMILKCVADASWSFLILWHTVRQSSPVHLCVSFKWEYEICVFSEVMSEVFTGGERCCHVFRGHKTSRWESLLCWRAIKSRLKIDRSYYADKLKKKQREREMRRGSNGAEENLQSLIETSDRNERENKNYTRRVWMCSSLHSRHFTHL